MDPEVIVLNDGETFSGAAGTFMVDTDGRVYDLRSILLETPKWLFDKYRLTREGSPTLFDRMERAIADTDDSFTGLR